MGFCDLTLTLSNEPFVISGPNGSGKSGVVDAIQFALTGEMGRLKGACGHIRSFEGAMAARERIEAGWAKPPANLGVQLKELQSRVKARPDKSATEQARSFLVIAQERLETLRRSRRDLEEKKANAARGRAAYKAYCDISEKALTSLYEQVEEEFAAFYRLINHDDEGEFKAKLEPADGKLDLRVDFHKKGMFPPSAYHSEGHQDGMGVCLYLALMKHVMGANFTFAVLDDVVM